MTIYRSILEGETLLPGDERRSRNSWKPIAEKFHFTKLKYKEQICRHRREAELKDLNLRRGK